MKWLESLEKVKSIATTAVAVYPLFAGLYILGLFWHAPFDLLGAFSPTVFIFKSAVVFFGIAAIVVSYFCIMSFYNILVIEKVIGTIPETEESGSSSQPIHKQWGHMSFKQLVSIVFIHILLLILLGIVFYLDPVPIKSASGPDILAFLLFAGLMFQVLIKLSVDLENWKLLKILYLLSCVLVLPLWVGYQDYEISSNDAKFVHEGEDCIVRFAADNSILAKCGNKEKMIQKDMADIIYEIH